MHSKHYRTIKIAMEPRDFYAYHERYKSVKEDLKHNQQVIQRIEEAIECPQKREGLSEEYLKTKLKEVMRTQQSILLLLNQLETKKSK